jgi:hypothetical protein
MTGQGVRLGITPDEQAAAIDALRKQADVLIRIVRAESKLCGLTDQGAVRLAERINHWWLYGEPMPVGRTREDEFERMADGMMEGRGWSGA